ncbi:hypothetical protein [uncultured Gammaproteobacteria bacterium]|nr:hypothetical protein [uncultured Gammaproteobacteria bacterium]
MLEKTYHKLSKYHVIFYYPNKEDIYILKIDSCGDIYK